MNQNREELLFQLTLTNVFQQGRNNRKRKRFRAEEFYPLTVRAERASPDATSMVCWLHFRRGTAAGAP
jgi:uncharacterized Fe-S cluster-containing radical SAM superfamily protein